MGSLLKQGDLVSIMKQHIISMNSEYNSQKAVVSFNS